MGMDLDRKEHQDALNHPIWSALHTGHAHFAQGDNLARRYPADVSPLAAIREQSPEAYASLGELLGPDEPVVLFLDASPPHPHGWRLFQDF